MSPPRSAPQTGRVVKHIDPPVEVARKTMVDKGKPTNVADMLSGVMVALRLVVRAKRPVASGR